MDNKNAKIALISIVVLILIGLVIAIFAGNKKSYDLTQAEEFFLRGYEEEELRSMDFIDVQDVFGLNLDEYEEHMFLTNIQFGSDTKDDMLIVVMKTNNEETYDILYSFIEAQKLYSTEKEILELYDKAISKMNGDYIYIIVAPDSALVERELNAYYK